MNTISLKPSIWLVTLVLIFLSIGLFCLFSFYYYYAYSFNATFEIELLNLNLEGNPPRWMIHTKISLLIAANMVAIYVFRSVRKLLLSFERIGPFAKSSVARLKIISRWTLILVVLYAIAYLAIEFFSGDLNISINTSLLILLFLLSLVYVMVEVFQYGAALYEDHQHTI